MHKVVMLFAFLILNLSFFISNSEAGTVQLPQTGQTTCYDSSGVVINCGGTGQDGNLRAGVQWPNPRFTVNGDCVTDNLTGLVWAKDANLPGSGLTWQGALDWVAAMNSGDGLCGYHDWRLPNLNELESLTNAEVDGMYWLWANGQVFINFYFGYYWSSSTYAKLTGYAWIVSMFEGLGNSVGAGRKSGDTYYLGDGSNGVWPVRAGQ